MEIDDHDLITLGKYIIAHMPPFVSLSIMGSTSSDEMALIFFAQFGTRFCDVSIPFSFDRFKSYSNEDKVYSAHLIMSQGLTTLEDRFDKASDFHDPRFDFHDPLIWMRTYVKPKAS